ncbi:hypothetical protein [Planomicrobium sp. CPCC 101110]|uniref:hypothetical protein n=1 Tax=Planomicrobium sp. CPCC 101110 TaxID=2599619 RepID=UPI0011B5B0E9|nr:hypothetical protein [Planomicrobium sp. CPCC 101110]TWT25331.1 hypothetical protein FQV30_13295 [Planomicrobium sp. CPCC 101110]
MKEAAGFILIAQALITGVIVYALLQLGDSIQAAAAYTATGEGQLAWGSGIPSLALAALAIVAGMGIWLIVKGKKAGH